MVGQTVVNAMNIILLDPGEVIDQSVLLGDRRADHIVKILRAQPGDIVKIGILNGKIGYGTIKELNRTEPRSVRLQLDLCHDPPGEPRIDLILALPRPIMLKRIVHQLASLGIGRLYLINAAKVEKSFWEASILDQENLRQHLVAGLEQAVDTRLPEVSLHRGFRPFVENLLPQLKARYDRMLVAHPGEADHLRSVLHPGSGNILLAVGPEGGWNDFEVRSLAEAGFTPVSLGARILRVETAVIVLHAMISLLQEAASEPPPGCRPVESSGR